MHSKLWSTGLKGAGQESWGPILHAGRPVSRWRRVAAAVLLAGLLAGVWAYYRFTDEERLRRYAQAWLQDFSGGEAHIDQVRFDPFKGLHLVGVTVAAPASAHFDPGDESLAGRSVFHAATVFLRLRLPSVLTGRLVVPEIVAEDPELTLTRRLSDGKWNWETLFFRRKRRSAAGPIQLPVVRLRNVELRTERLDERGRIRGEAQKIWIEAAPKADKPECYDVEVTKLYGEGGGQPMTRETSRLAINMRTMAVAGSLPSVALHDLLLAAPAGAVRWLDACAMRGFVRADHFEYQPEGPTAGLLTLRDAGMSLPMNEADRAVPAGRRYLRLDGLEGTIRFSGDRATVDLSGRFRSQPLALKGTLRLRESDVNRQAASQPTGGQRQATQPDADAGEQWAAVGYELEITLKNYQLPRGADAKDPAERGFVQFWPLIAEQVRDFDGAGAVDVMVKVRREARPDARVEFAEGAVDFKGCSARYVSFPYRLHELTGRIWVRPDGLVELVNIVGRHGAGKVIVQGLLGGRISTQGDLDVTGQDIFLDESLLACLDERDRQLIRRFNATARADVKVHMLRPATPLDQPPGPWRTAIDIQFTDGTLNLADFPYPMERLTGRMHVAGGRMEVADFCCRRGDARVCVNGAAEDVPGKGFGLDLHVKASGVALDETLSKALPTAGRKLYERYTPTGRAEVTGRLFTPEPGGPAQCDLRAVLAGGSLAIPGGRERITHCQAVLHVRPTELVIESLAGRFGESPLEAEGWLPLAADEQALSLHVKSERMVLDDRLQSVLPPGVRRVWDSFRPAGVAAFDVRYRQGAAASQPAATSRPADDADKVDYTVVIEPLDCQMRYQEFPLALSQVKGRIVVQPGRVLIDRLAARHDGATIEGVGAVDIAPERTLITMTVDATDLALAEPLRQALPWRLRRLWNDLRPAGKVDLKFDKLLLTWPTGRPVTWSFDGAAKLKGVAMRVGPDLTEVTGRLRASGEVGDEYAFQGDLDWSEARVEGWKVENLKAGFSRPPGEGRLRLSRIEGQFYQGKVIGEVEIKDGPRGSEYGLSLTARDVSLGDFLNARPAPGEQPVKLNGIVEGNLALAGRFGDVASRHGGGTVLIHHAQMLKVPFVLAMMQVVHLAIDDDNAFHDARLSFIVDADDLLFQEIDLRGKSLSMVGAGRVNTPREALDLVLLVGSPLKLPRMEVLSELVEGLARELVEVHVEGKLTEPSFRAEIVRSVRRTVDTILNARERHPR